MATLTSVMWMWQKVTTFNRSKPSLIAIGSTNSQLAVLTYPGLEAALPSLDYDGDELYDVDFDDAGEMVNIFTILHPKAKD